MVFAVDEVTRSATFRVAPRWLLVVGDRSVEVGAGPADVAVEMR